MTVRVSAMVSGEIPEQVRIAEESMRSTRNSRHPLTYHEDVVDGTIFMVL